MTVWEGKIKSGLTYQYNFGKKGLQFISDGTKLSEIQDSSYDFVLSSNCLEHIANPLKALFEWRRVIREGGVIVLVLPNKKSNFDRSRPDTSFEHICEDYVNDTKESDLTHLDEILKLHDLTMDISAGTFEQFKTRSLDNFNNRTLHHHIFDIQLMRKMFEYVGMKALYEIETESNFIMLAEK